MGAAARSLLSRAAHQLGTSADALISDVAQVLREQVPELWEDPDIARMTSENIAEHIAGALVGIEYGIEPDKIEPPEGSRRCPG
ncbi:hypothetical protein [Streptomyces sp. NPDC056660]|uniref:hypothetical protein n=1 Tax=Streptomyces sp. NPDC056660 TaxID=3345897 RepID=UPI0036B3294D